MGATHQPLKLLGVVIGCISAYICCLEQLKSPFPSTSHMLGTTLTTGPSNRVSNRARANLGHLSSRKPIIHHVPRALSSQPSYMQSPPSRLFHSVIVQRGAIDGSLNLNGWRSHSHSKSKASLVSCHSQDSDQTTQQGQGQEQGQGQGPPPLGDELMMQIESMSGMVIDKMSRLHNSGSFEFGYDSDSLKYVDQLIDRNRQVWLKDGSLQRMMSMFGSFLGQVLIKEYGGIWVDGYGIQIEEGDMG
ncbi:hypothetical protein AAMO2058_001102100 [Amorphochlora amoebiformis]